MEMLAEQILSDLRYAIDELEMTEDMQAFRVFCVAAATLNRTVGYALKKDPNPRIREVSNQLYQEWKSDSNCIFNYFINKYRNHVIHDAELDLEAYLPIAAMNAEGRAGIYLNDDLLYVPLVDSEYGDLDIRDLFNESFNWWLEQLTRIKILATDLKTDTIKNE